MEALGAVVLVYIVAAAIAFYVTYWIIRLAVRHGIRDARKPEPVKTTPAPVPATPTWFSKDA